MPVQDDAREEELLKRFELDRPPNSSRSGTDATLNLEGQEILFELKSTTTGSVTTVRDFGHDHISKWQGKHWLIGVYAADGKTLRYCLYGSPKAMARWIDEKSEYVRVDFDLADKVPELIDLESMYKILGRKSRYTIEEARKLHKKQYTAEQYRDLMDIPEGYSPHGMLSIVQDRCRYLIKRGSTLNNPHIPASYFEGWERITENHASRLRKLVRQFLQQEKD